MKSMMLVSAALALGAGLGACNKPAANNTTPDTSAATAPAAGDTNTTTSGNMTGTAGNTTGPTGNATETNPSTNSSTGPG